MRHALLISRWDPFTDPHKEEVDKLLHGKRKAVILLVVNRPGAYPVDLRCEMIMACYPEEFKDRRLRIVVVPDLDEIGMLESDEVTRNASVPTPVREVIERWQAEGEPRRISEWLKEKGRRGGTSGAPSADTGTGTGS